MSHTHTHTHSIHMCKNAYLSSWEANGAETLWAVCRRISSRQSQHHCQCGLNRGEGCPAESHSLAMLEVGPLSTPGRDRKVSLFREPGNSIVRYSGPKPASAALENDLSHVSQQACDYCPGVKLKTRPPTPESNQIRFCSSVEVWGGVGDSNGSVFAKVHLVKASLRL